MRVVHHGPEDTRLVVELWLRSEGYSLTQALDTEDLVSTVRHTEIDMVVVSDESPRSVVSVLRRSGLTTGVIVVGHCPDYAAMVLEAGADDYVMMPIPRAEFCARLRAIWRRSRGLAQSRATVGNTTLDISSMRVLVGERQIHFTPRQMSILIATMTKGGRVARRGEIMSEMWDIDAERTQKNVDVQLCKLRARLRHAGSSMQIRTVRGQGWCAEAV